MGKGVVAIIQARMGSSRFPGKVLRPLAGKPVLWHLVQRLRMAEHVDAIAIATSTNQIDDPIVSFGETEGVAVMRGSEQDVLKRYKKAVDLLDPDIILRVTGDSPLLDPVFVDRMVETIKNSGAPRTIAQTGVPCIHEGVGVVHRKAFEWLWQNARDDPVAKEHVTGYFHIEGDALPAVCVEIPPEERFEARISVDTPADLAFLDTVYRELGAEAGMIDIRAVVKLLKARPDLVNMNAHVARKGTQTREKTVLIRCDASASVGQGHLTRCLALAEALTTHHAAGVVFAIDADEEAQEKAQAHGHRVETRPLNQDHSEWLDRLVSRVQPGIVFLDVREGLGPDDVQNLRRPGRLVVAFDDPTDARIGADLAVYPPVPQVDEFSWDGFEGKVVTDWGLMPVQRRFQPRGSLPENDTPRVLVTMGGSDPLRLTEKVLDSLRLVERALEVLLVIGPNYNRDVDIPQGLGHTVNKFTSVEDMAQLMREADFAVATFGTTAFELISVGVPAVFLPISRLHGLTASALGEEGAGLVLDGPEEVSVEQIAGAITHLATDANARATIFRNTQKLLLHEGAMNLANLIMTQDTIKEVHP